MRIARDGNLEEWGLQRWSSRKEHLLAITETRVWTPPSTYQAVCPAHTYNPVYEEGRDSGIIGFCLFPM